AVSGERRVRKERIRDLLLELVRIDSHSRKEGRVAERVAGEMRDLGATEVVVDDAGEKVGGETGNVIALFPGTRPEAPPLLLSAHMDTVVPGEGVKPVVDGDVVRSDGTTVLGGDDKSGIAIICECLRVLRERSIPHGPVDAVFTICEEKGLLGAKHLDVRKLRARSGVVLDSDSPGFLFTRAPGANAIHVRVHGLEAHAGMAPEKGLSAIRIASEAIAAMRLGRIDDETTANLGVVRGGAAINIIPKLVELWGEARSHSEEKLREQTEHMRRCFEDAAARHSVEIDDETRRARIEFGVEREYEAMKVPDASPIVRLVVRAGERVGTAVTVTGMGGGCDANILNRRGFEVANLGTGMRDIHTVKEWLDVNDMVLTAEVLLEAIRLNAEG
ncbi:MAG: M20/M25/M40 family metallo-hydrolase, partial [Candidatus Binatia bacterium]